MSKVDDLLDRAAITEVLMRYAHAIDRHDRELARTCYHDDATDDHGRFNGPVDELFEFFEKYGSSLNATYHFMAPPLIVLEGNTAHVETYCLYRRDAKGKPALLQGLRYVDVLEKREVWKIARRTVVLDWENEGLSEPGEASPPTWIRGSASTSDPSGAITSALRKEQSLP